MTSLSHPDTPDPSEPALQVAGVRLVDIAGGPGPFGSVFIGPGADLVDRARFAIDTVPIPAPHAGVLLASIEDSQARSQAVVTNGSDVWRFLLDDPLVVDLARFGDAPSLGPIIEASQVTASHVVVTIEDDVFGLTSFETVTSQAIPVDGQEQPLAEPLILEALDHVVDRLRSLQPRMVALMGAAVEISDVREYLQRELPSIRCNVYPSDDIDRDLLETADDIVKDAASLAAEQRTHELAHFRQARSAAQTQEGQAALGAIEVGSAQRLLVHDDVAASSEGDDGSMIDRVISAALRMHVPITTIPKVPADRGPKGGVGVITVGHGTAVPAEAAEPVDRSELQLVDRAAQRLT